MSTTQESSQDPQELSCAAPIGSVWREHNAGELDRAVPSIRPGIGVSGGGAVQIDRTSTVPPYEQVRTQLTAMIRSGELPVGSRLPTVRGFADELGLAVNTVARVYRELEAVGLVQTRGRAGTFVHTEDATLDTAQAAARAYAEVIRATGLGVDEALGLVRTALGRDRAPG